MPNYICELAEGSGVEGKTRMTKLGWVRMCETYFKNKSSKARGKNHWNRLTNSGESRHTCDDCALGKARWKKKKDLYPNNINWIEI